jgi:hypothetical protein
MRSTLRAIAETLDADELRAAAKQAYEDSFDQAGITSHPVAPKQVAGEQ